MNMYQDLLSLHGFRVRPEDLINRESAADARCGTAASMTPSAVVPPDDDTDALPVAGQCLSQCGLSRT